MKIRFLQYISSPENLEFLQPLTTKLQQNFFAPTKKTFLSVGKGVYTMANKDANRDYQKETKSERL